MNKIFQKGDRVAMKDGSNFSNRSSVATIKKVSQGQVYFEEGVLGWCYPRQLVKVNYGPEHPHKDTIIAYADGAVIEWKSEAGKWVEQRNPSFYKEYEYRIKPYIEPVDPKQEEIKRIESEMRQLVDDLKKLKEE